MNEPYRVIVDVEGCSKCSQGKAWAIVGPDGINADISFQDEYDAKEWADTLNRAYTLGQASSHPIVRTEDKLLKAFNHAVDGDDDQRASWLLNHEDMIRSILSALELAQRP